MPGVLPPLFVNVPAAAPLNPSDHTAVVAPPPIDPPKAEVVPPWQIAAIAPPASTVGFGLITIVLFAEVVPQLPPAVVSVNIIEDGADAEAIYVTVPVVFPPLFVKVPAVGPVNPSDQTADVAPPPKDPPNAAVVPPWQIATTGPPAFTVGVGFTVNNLLSDVVPHEPPLLVKVKVIEAGAEAEAV